MQNRLTVCEIAEELLGRRADGLFGAETLESFKGQTVLVTGGGGSVGSELCRCIAACGPRELIIFDIYENCAYELYDELSSLYGDAFDIRVEIGSVRDKKRLKLLFSKYKIDTVFHAAAHKHVPLMEECAPEAVKNNVLGTYNVCAATKDAGCGRFVLISTDKAVRPVSVMGATKRLCEMIVESMRGGKTAFSSVRFGNVLGSAGSVLPLFIKQIERGGPIRLTDRRMKRYFMTPREAAGLVMEAAAIGGEGELYVLDMGEQVNLYDMCLRLIELMGYDKTQISIEETGIRPGEKLSEEILIGGEHSVCKNGRIFAEKEKPVSGDEIEKALRELEAAAESGDNGLIKKALSRAVPEYSGI
ncbi:MAG: polysaccharide biosynthesis protein [Clostridia bacterium]|nr:polysaccharide biosynthesis protein [Clostridia bacterium]